MPSGPGWHPLFFSVSPGFPFLREVLPPCPPCFGTLPDSLVPRKKVCPACPRLSGHLGGPRQSPKLFDCSTASVGGGHDHGAWASSGPGCGHDREESAGHPVFQRPTTRPCLWWAPCSIGTWAASWPFRGGHRGTHGKQGCGEGRPEGMGVAGVAGVQGRGRGPHRRGPGHPDPAC